MIRIATALALFAGLTVSSSADDGIPDLTGNWSVTLGYVILADGKVNQYPDDYVGQVIEIKDQTGAVFKATQTITPRSDTTTGTHAGAPLRGQTTDLLGAIDGTGPFVVLVDIGDTTQYQCNLEDEDTMRCLVAEAGDHAIAGFILFKRGK